jgi:hypothetical protein
MRPRLPAIALLASLAFGLGFAGSASAASPAGAAGAGYAAATASSSQPLVQEAQYRDREWRRDRREWRRDRREWRRDRRHWRQHHRRDWRDWRGPGIYFQIEPRRYYRPAPRPSYRLPVSHYRWCERRYRSYRSWDNTFQPYHGPRQQCYSPYS